MKSDITKLNFFKFMLSYAQAKNAPRCKNCLCNKKAVEKSIAFFVRI